MEFQYEYPDDRDTLLIDIPPEGNAYIFILCMDIDIVIHPIGIYPIDIMKDIIDGIYTFYDKSSLMYTGHIVSYMRDGYYPDGTPIPDIMRDILEKLVIRDIEDIFLMCIDSKGNSLYSEYI